MINSLPNQIPNNNYQQNQPDLSFMDNEPMAANSAFGGFGTSF